MTKARKTKAQLDREIKEVLVKPQKLSERERREAAALTRRQAAFDMSTEWRLQTLDQIARWMVESNQAPVDKFPRNTVIKHLDKLETFLRVFFPEAGQAPFDPYDAAALIVLPRWKAARLARKLFSGGPGISKDLQTEDLKDLGFNMDWFIPKDFQ